MGRNLGPLNIKDSYEGLVQISGSQLTDGSGSLIPSLDVSASYATQALTASFAENVTTPTLQEVTDAGATTTNDISISNRVYGQIGISSGNSGETYTVRGGTVNATLTLQGNDVASTNSIKLNPTYGIQLSGSATFQDEIIIDSTAAKTLVTKGGIEISSSTFPTLEIQSLDATADGTLLFQSGSTYIGYVAGTTNHLELGDFNSAKVKVSGSSLEVDLALTASGLNYPDTDGTAGQVVTTDGAGNLTLEDAAGGAAFPYTGSAEITGSLVVSGSIITGVNNAVGNTTATNAIIGGTGLTGGASIDNSLLMGGLNNSIGYGNESVIIGGESNTTEQTRVAIIGGFSHKVTRNEGGIFVGNNNEVRQGKGVVLGGNDNTLRNYNGNSSAILSGGSNQARGNQYAAIVAGQSNSLLTSGSEDSGPVSGSAIVGGISNTIVDGQVSAIIGGENHYMDGVDKSVIIGGDGITATVNSTVYVPNLDISGSLTDSDGNIGTVGQVLTSNGTDKVQWDTAAGGAAFPYTGSAEITGSLGLTGSLSQGDTNSNLGTNTAILSSGHSLISASVVNTTIIASSGSYQSTTQPGRTAIIASDNSYIDSTSAGNNDDIALIGTLSSRFTGGGARQAVIMATNNAYNNGSRFSFIGGGENHVMSGQYANAIVGGNGNRMVQGTNSAIAGGGGNRIGNTSVAQYGFVAGGSNNYLDGDNSAIIAGTNGDNNHDRSVILGGASLATTKNDEVVVEHLSTNGAVVQDVKALTITSNTASLDAATGQMFTLGLQNGVDTRLELSNQVAGQTFSLKITNNATSAGTITFDNQFEFEGGTAFTATAATNAVDILTFTTFDGTSVQCVGSKNFS